MNHKKLFFILSLAGILVLVFLSQTLQPKLANINNITNINKNSNEKISIKGEIKEIKQRQKTISIFLKNQDIEIIVFTTKPLNLQKNQSVLINGRTDFYNNKLQIIADKITIQ